MSETGMYKQILLDHYRHPRNRSDLVDAQVVRRGSNPRCGDELEVGVNLSGDTLSKVEFRGRGCSVCLASASMMTEAVNGRSINAAEKLFTQMQRWFGDNSPDRQAAVQASEAAPAGMEALAAVREHPGRRRCVLLAWEALHDAITAS